MMRISRWLLLIALLDPRNVVSVGNASASQPADVRWDRRFAPPGVQGAVLAMAFDHQRIYLGGAMQSVGRARVETVAQGDGNHWRNLEGGPVPNELFWPNVLALAVFKGALYAGGYFDVVGDQPAGGLARWDGKSWSVPVGTAGDVYFLQTDARALYASGRFTLPGSINGVTLARWDGGEWEVLSGQSICNSASCPEEVGDFEIIGNDVFALVTWHLGPGQYYYGIARLNKPGQWTVFAGPGGTNAFAYYGALTTRRGQLVVGGEFTNSANAALRNVALWNGKTWQSLGNGLAGEVVDLAGDEYRLGALHRLPDTNGFGGYVVSEWNGQRWATLGTNQFERTDGPIRVFIGPRGDVYVTGSFAGIRPVAAASIVRWNGERWEPLFEGDYEGLAGGIPAVLAFTEHQGEVYLGGSFITAGDVFSPGMARWDGRQMRGVGGGFEDEPYRVVRSLSSSGERLFAGGTFNSIGGIAATNIAAWDGHRWQPLGSGLPGSPRTLAWWRGSLYAGGFFQARGSNTSFNFARWDGKQWTLARLGSNASVSALMVWRDQLYAGGSFAQAGPLTVSRLARWDGSQWHDVGDGVFSTGRVSVTELAVGSDGLYVAGSFTRAGKVMATNMARWDGTNWYPLGQGWPGSIQALAVQGTTVFVGGRLTNDLGVVQHLGRWDGRSWSPLGSDLSDARFGDVTRAAALLATDDAVFVGGIFTTAGAKPSAGIARWVERPRIHIGKTSGRAHETDKFHVRREPGLNWHLETSTDLRNWVLLPDDENDEGQGSKLNTNSPARFFRAVLEP